MLADIMPKTSPTAPFWFIRDGEKLRQCSKFDFDQAIIDGKSVRYRGYANKKCERVAEHLEESRMALLAKPDLPRKFLAVITNPEKVVDVQIIAVNDPEFWIKESKKLKYQT